MSSFSVSVEGLVAMPVLKNSARCEENLLSTTMGAPLRETIEGLETLTTEYRKQRLSGEDRQQFTSETSLCPARISLLTTQLANKKMPAPKDWHLRTDY